MTRAHRFLSALSLSIVGLIVLSACTSGAPASPPPAPTEAPAQVVPTATAVPEPTSVPPTPEPVAAKVRTAPEPQVNHSIVTPPTGNETVVPEITGIASWINSEPFTFEEKRGEVVLVDFWTYTCVNCIRTLPFLKAWHEKYEDHGLVIVGVHTPEFEFEKDRENVIDATNEFGLKWAIAQDNDFGTWRAFNNRFWPAKYLVDKDGLIRYTHFGEGAYDETESWIRGLLEETGADLSDIPANTVPEPLTDAGIHNAAPGLGLTREIYAGFERNYGSLLSQSPPYVLHREYYEERDVEVLYEDPGEHQNHFLYLQGLWRNDLESIIHSRDTDDYVDYLANQFFATSVNAVMTTLDGEPAMIRVTLNEEPIKPEDAGVDVMFDDDGHGYIAVDEPRMYNIVDLDQFGGHKLKLFSKDKGFSLFAYTFGGYQGGEPAPTGPNG